MKTLKKTMKIEPRHAASVLGSGSLDVFATPAMVAFMENVAAELIDHLEEGFTTVGTEINVQHLKASGIGEEVACTAELTEQKGGTYLFNIYVTDASGNKIGTATHKRVAVEIERFMKKVYEP